MDTLLKTTLITALMLVIPLFGNRYVEGWNWHLIDFVVVGVLFFGTALLFKLISSKVTNKTYRIVLVVALVLLFFLVWTDLAVGIFNIPRISGS